MSYMGIDLLEKWSEKKKHRQTSTKIWPDAMRTGTRFWTAKCQIPVAKPLKRCPHIEQRISLKNPTNEHLRLASVVGTLLKLRLRRNKWLKARFFWDIF